MQLPRDCTMCIVACVIGDAAQQRLETLHRRLQLTQQSVEQPMHRGNMQHATLRAGPKNQQEDADAPRLDKVPC